MNNIEKYPNCSMRTSLGNCNPIGGFCASVNDPICEAFHKLKPDWIPCGESLPEDPGKGCDFGSKTYNVTVLIGEIPKTTHAAYVKRTIDGESVLRWEWMGVICPWEIIAWMAMPTPYEGDK